MFGSKHSGTGGRSEKRRSRDKLAKKQPLGHEQLDKRQLLTGFAGMYQYPNYGYSSYGYSSSLGSSYGGYGYGGYGSSYGGYGSSLGAAFGGYGSSYGSLSSAFGSSGLSYGGYGSSYAGLGSSYAGLGSSYGGYGNASSVPEYSSGIRTVVMPANHDYGGTSIVIKGSGASTGTYSGSGSSTSSWTSNVMSPTQNWLSSLTSNLDVYGKASAGMNIGGFNKGGSISYGTNGWQTDASSGYRSGSAGAGTSGVQATWGGDLNFGGIGVVSGSVSKSQAGGYSGEICVGAGRSQSLPASGGKTASASAKLQICVSSKMPMAATPVATPRANAWGGQTTRSGRMR